jgi:xanthine dehydrogenase accessory factor
MFTAEVTVVIRGGGDLGSGVALRLWRAGFRVIVLESESPLAVRRSVALSEAVYDGEAHVEGMSGQRAGDADDALRIARSGRVPVLVDPQAASLPVLRPDVLVDAILAKRNLGTTRDMAPLTVGLGPGFIAGEDVDLVVETNRGPHLGRVIHQGGAEPNTHRPAPVAGHAEDRVLRAPADGPLTVVRDIGSTVDGGSTVALVGDAPVVAPFRGMVRGMARPGLTVHSGMKIGDIDPRIEPALCTLVSDKSLAIAGGVVEAILEWLRDNRS